MLFPVPAEFDFFFKMLIEFCRIFTNVFKMKNLKRSLEFRKKTARFHGNFREISGIGEKYSVLVYSIQFIQLHSIPHFLRAGLALCADREAAGREAPHDLSSSLLRSSWIRKISLTEDLQTEAPQELCGENAAK